MTSSPLGDQSNAGGSTICDKCGTDFKVSSAGYKLNKMTLCYGCHSKREFKQERVNDRAPEGPTESSMRRSESFNQSIPKASNEGFFSFQKMISVTLIKALYVIGSIGLIIAGIGMIAKGADMYRGEGLIIGGIAIMTLGNLSWRLICESLIVLFSLHETTISILKELKRK